MSHFHNLNEHYVTLVSNNSMDFYPNNTLSSFTNILPVPLELNGDWVVGINDLCMVLPKNSYCYKLDKEPPCDSRMRYPVFIYTDIVKQRMIGDTFVKCIKILHTTGEDEYISFPRVEYHPLASNFIRDITLLFQNEENVQIELLSSYKPTMCTLHFKKVNV